MSGFFVVFCGVAPIFPASGDPSPSLFVVAICVFKCLRALRLLQQIELAIELKREEKRDIEEKWSAIDS